MVGNPLPTSFNRDVPQEVVRRVLDHDSHAMTAHSASTAVRHHHPPRNRPGDRTLAVSLCDNR